MNILHIESEKPKRTDDEHNGAAKYYVYLEVELEGPFKRLLTLIPVAATIWQ